MTDGTEKSLLSSTINAFNKIDKTTATKRKAEQYESCSAFVRHIDTKRYTLHNLIQFNSTLLAERYTSTACKQHAARVVELGSD